MPISEWVKLYIYLSTVFIYCEFHEVSDEIFLICCHIPSILNSVSCSRESCCSFNKWINQWALRKIQWLDQQNGKIGVKIQSPDNQHCNPSLYYSRFWSSFKSLDSNDDSMYTFKQHITMQLKLLTMSSNSCNNISSECPSYNAIFDTFMGLHGWKLSLKMLYTWVCFLENHKAHEHIEDSDL